MMIAHWLKMSKKQLNVAFAMMKAAHCCFGCRLPTGEFADAHC
jgi:hypothetical protein